MKRLVIIDHDEHTLFIEDVTNEMLAHYNGDEQAYINDNYDMENYSWDYITDSVFIDENGDAIDISADIDQYSMAYN